MNAMRLLCLVGLSLPLPAWSIGYIYTGAGGNGRELMAIHSVAVDVDIQDRVALTHVDQVFANRSDSQVEGIYEFALPAGASITSLVLWIGDRRVQALVLEKSAGRRVYDNIVAGRTDPALVEQTAENRFRLSIYPFPAQGSRRIELEYLQLLEARTDTLAYAFPLAAEGISLPQIDSLAVHLVAHGRVPLTAALAPPYRELASLSQPDDHTVDLSLVVTNLIPTADLKLQLVEAQDQPLPRALSWQPGGAGTLGYYALWLPLPRDWSQQQVAERSLTFVIDASADSAGTRMQAEKDLFAAALAALPDRASFNLVVFGDSASVLFPGPAKATADNKDQALRALNALPGLGAPRYDLALQGMLRQEFPPGIRQDFYLLTDARPAIYDTSAQAIYQAAGLIDKGRQRLFVLGLGTGTPHELLSRLARDGNGEAQAVPTADAGVSVLHQWFGEAAKPVFSPSALRLSGAGVQDAFPALPAQVVTGREVFQAGRYEIGGPLTARLEGTLEDSAVYAEYPVEFVQGAPFDLAALGDSAQVLLYDDFDDGIADGWSKAGGTSGNWSVDAIRGVYQLTNVNGIGRTYHPVPASSYTIETRMRFSSGEGKILLHSADQGERWRLDLFGNNVRLILRGVGLYSETFPFSLYDAWHVVRVEVGDRLVRISIDGVEIQHGIPLIDTVPDGVIGIGGYATSRVEFDYVRVLEGVGNRTLFEMGIGEEPAEKQGGLVARLWAYQKVLALEEQIARDGEQQELLDGILDLGLTYRLVTRRTSLFVPDESVVTDPVARADAAAGECATCFDSGVPGSTAADACTICDGSDGDRDSGASAVEDSTATATWIGKVFDLRQGVWVDRDFQPGMEITPYRGQPASLVGFARLNLRLLVVAEGRAYTFEPGDQPAQAVLQPNAPNPFNALTLIRFTLPESLAKAPLRLGIYNLAGQLVRQLHPQALHAGENSLIWDGLDAQGRDAGSGVYLCRLEGPGFALTRRMLLLR